MELYLCVIKSYTFLYILWFKPARIFWIPSYSDQYLTQIVNGYNPISVESNWICPDISKWKYIWEYIQHNNDYIQLTSLHEKKYQRYWVSWPYIFLLHKLAKVHIYKLFKNKIMYISFYQATMNSIKNAYSNNNTRAIELKVFYKCYNSIKIKVWG